MSYSPYMEALDCLGVVFDRLLKDLEQKSFDIRFVDAFCELFCRYAVDIGEDGEFGHVYRDRIFSWFVRAVACGEVNVGDVGRVADLLYRLDRVEFPELYS